jgi:hypothetical protein
MVDFSRCRSLLSVPVTTVSTIGEPSNQPLARKATRSYCFRDQADAQSRRDWTASLSLADLQFRFGHWSATPRLESIVYRVSLRKKPSQKRTNSAAGSGLRRGNRKCHIEGYKILNITIELLRFCTALEWYILWVCSILGRAATYWQNLWKDECKMIRCSQNI